jgi:acetyl-CoA acyltransferase 1
MTDGAACVLLASRSFALKHRLPVVAVFRSYAVVGCPPEIMGIGPAIAIPAALKKVPHTMTILTSKQTHYNGQWDS